MKSSRTFCFPTCMCPLATARWRFLLTTARCHEATIFPASRSSSPFTYVSMLRHRRATMLNIDCYKCNLQAALSQDVSALRVVARLSRLTVFPLTAMLMAVFFFANGVGPLTCCAIQKTNNCYGRKVLEAIENINIYYQL